VKIRAGIASGLVIAGVVGKSMPKFTLFGDTVTLASQVESTSSSMRVQCTDLTQRLLRDSTTRQFSLEERRDGKMEQTTWWITADDSKGKSGFQLNTEPPSQRYLPQRGSTGDDTTGMNTGSTNAKTDSKAQTGGLSDVEAPVQTNPPQHETKNGESCSGLDLADDTHQQQIAPASPAEIAKLSWTHVYKSRNGDAEEPASNLRANGIHDAGEVESGRRKSLIDNIRHIMTSRPVESNPVSDLHHSFGSLLSSVGSITTSLEGDKGFDLTSIYSKDSAAFHNYWSR